MFWRSFRFTTKLRGRYRGVRDALCSTHAQPAHYQSFLPEWFIWDHDEPMMDRSHPWESLVYLRAQCGGVHFTGLEKCARTYTHHHIIIQDSFSALKALCALPARPYPPTTPDLCLHSFAFSGTQSSINLHFPDDCNVEHLFTCLLAIHLSFYWR